MTMELLAKTLSGLEPLLETEIRNLGGKRVRLLKRAVAFEGDKAMMYKMNYSLRTALRILMPVSRFNARNPEELYDRVRTVAWNDYLDNTGSLLVDAVVYSQVFRHSGYAALKVKDAIVDQFMERTNRRPSVAREEPDVRINLHISGTDCTLSLDSSDESLHKRGTRVAMTEAPLNEVLAAGMVMLSGWDGTRPLVDPMCGSGSLLIEAALMALGIPPGAAGRKYGFQRWPDYDASEFDRIRSEYPAEPLKEPDISGSDSSVPAIRACRANLAAAGLGKKVRIRQLDFFERQPDSGNGLVIMNPPYGERLAQSGINDFYKRLGDKLKSDFTGWDAWILGGNPEAMKHFGLRPYRRHTLFNGPIECRFNGYRLYQGSLKSSS